MPATIKLNSLSDIINLLKKSEEWPKSQQKNLYILMAIKFDESFIILKFTHSGQKGSEVNMDVISTSCQNIAQGDSFRVPFSGIGALLQAITQMLLELTRTKKVQQPKSLVDKIRYDIYCLDTPYPIPTVQSLTANA